MNGTTTAAVLFDLGNTLAAYYQHQRVPSNLGGGNWRRRDELTRRGLCRVSEESVMAAAVTENREAPDHRVTPMIDRFERIFAVLKRGA